MNKLKIITNKPVEVLDEGFDELNDTFNQHLYDDYKFDEVALDECLLYSRKETVVAHDPEDDMA